MKEVKKANVLVIILAGIIVSFALSCNILVADNELAQNSYGRGLLEYDYTNTITEPPVLAIDIIKIKQLLDTSSTMTMALITAGFSFVLLWMSRQNRLKISPDIILVSICFGIIQVFGLSLCELGNWDFIFANSFQMVVSSICMFGYALMGYVAIMMVFSILDCLNEKLCKAMSADSKGILHRKHPIILPFMIIIMCWSPYLIFSYPGSLSWDSANQIAQAVGLSTYNSHHPIVSSFIQGICVKVGDIIGNPNLGLFLYVVLQVVICALAFSLIVYGYIFLGLPNKLVYLVIAYYSLLPIFGGYMQSVIKDTLIYFRNPTGFNTQIGVKMS